MEFKIIKFDFQNAAPEVWDGYFRHADEMQCELHPEDPLLPWEKRKAMMISGEANPYSRACRFLAFPEDSTGVAAGFVSAVAETPLSPSYETNRQTGDLSLYVSPGCRSQGLGSLLLKRVIEELAARETSVTELLAHVNLDCGRRFIERRGGTLSIKFAENWLYFKEVDWPMVEAWAAEGERKNPGMAIKTVTAIPLDDIEEYCVVYAETMNQQPMGDLAVRAKCTPEQIRFGEKKNLEQGVTRTTIYSKEGDGHISGLTEIVYFKEAGHRVKQLLTGVREQYRGRGLGKLLKARMLLHVRKEYPEVKYVLTANADSNGAMLAINNKLGFKTDLPTKVYKLKIQG